MYKILCFIILLQFTIVSCEGEKSPDAKKDTTSINAKSTDKTSKGNKGVVESSPQERLGKRLFLLCAACHNLNKGEPHKVGPNLNGIFGTKAGLGEGFIYSEALKESDIVWNEEKMRQWIKDPVALVPGTNMAFIGIEKERQQDALIEYLKKATQ